MKEDKSCVLLNFPSVNVSLYWYLNVYTCSSSKYYWKFSKSIEKQQCVFLYTRSLPCYIYWILLHVYVYAVATALFWDFFPKVVQGRAFFLKWSRRILTCNSQQFFKDLLLKIYLISRSYISNNSIGLHFFLCKDILTCEEKQWIFKESETQE